MTLHVPAEDKGPFKQWNESLAPSSSVYFVPISEYQKKEHHDLVNAQKVIHHGIDVEDYPFKSKLNKNNYLFSIGRITKDKGQDKAIEAELNLQIHQITPEELLKRSSKYWNTWVHKAANFLVSYRDPQTHLPLPSYDLWEERYALHAFTVAAVIAGLRAAANFAQLFQDPTLAENYNTVAGEMAEGISQYLYHDGLKRFARSGSRIEGGYKLDDVIDISLLSIATFGVLDDPKDERMIATANAVREQLWLKTPVQGCARYQGDI